MNKQAFSLLENYFPAYKSKELRLLVALIFLFKQCHFLKVAYFQVIFSPFLQEKARFEVKVSGTGFPSFPYKGKFHLFCVCALLLWNYI